MTGPPKKRSQEDIAADVSVFAQLIDDDAEIRTRAILLLLEKHRSKLSRLIARRLIERGWLDVEDAQSRHRREDTLIWQDAFAYLENTVYSPDTIAGILSPDNPDQRRFDPHQPDGASLDTWLLRRASFNCSDFIRRTDRPGARYQPLSKTHEPVESGTSTESEPASLSRAERFAAIHAAVHAVSSPLQQASLAIRYSPLLPIDDAGMHGIVRVAVLNRLSPDVKPAQLESIDPDSRLAGIVAEEERRVRSLLEQLSDNSPVDLSRVETIQKLEQRIARWQIRLHHYEERRMFWHGRLREAHVSETELEQLEQTARTASQEKIAKKYRTASVAEHDATSVTGNNAAQMHSWKRNFERRCRQAAWARQCIQSLTTDRDGKLTATPAAAVLSESGEVDVSTYVKLPTQEQIAEILNTSPASVDSAIPRARQELAKHLPEELRRRLEQRQPAQPMDAPPKN